MNSKHFLLQATIRVYKYVKKYITQFPKNFEQYLNFYQPIIFSKL